MLVERDAVDGGLNGGIEQLDDDPSSTLAIDRLAQSAGGESKAGNQDCRQPYFLTKASSCR